MDNKISPRAPAMEAIIDIIAQALSILPLFGTNCPACRSHRSARKDRSRKTTVTTLPGINNALRGTPMLEMYLM